LKIAHTFEKFVSANGANIFRLPLEAFPKFWVYAYVVKSGENLVLIDTGSGSDQSNNGLIEGFNRVSDDLGKAIKIKDLTHILLTHGHIDHMGGLVFLREHSSALVGVHELDLQTISFHEERLTLISQRLDKYLAEAGVLEEERSQLLQIYKFTKAFFHSVAVDFTYEQAGMEYGPFSMVHLPGHCPGQVAIRLDDYIFSGDHVLSGITPHQSPESLIPYLGIGHYSDSLRIIEKWAEGSKLILTGHDLPIEDLPARTKEIRMAIANRLNHCMEFLSEPHCIRELTTHLYGDIAGYNALLVLEKTGAYIEYLYQHGMLEIINMDELEKTKPNPFKYRSVKQKTHSILVPKEKAYVFI
jgi:glyoxylase-like metal-dependent hydrolase (beta-lactamase superfamily II)